jgi:hypothetical protein
MNPIKLIFVTAIAALCTSLEARAFVPDVLQLYTTTDPTTASHRPPGTAPNTWSAQAAGAAVTIAPGTTVWFAFDNTHGPGKRKDFTFTMSGTGMGGLLPGAIEGFLGDDASNPVSTNIGTFNATSTLIVRTKRFTPQPAWERLSYKNPVGSAAVAVQVTGESVCVDRTMTSLASNSLTLAAASIGSATPGAMYGTPRYSSIWIFPTANSVDSSAAHPFSAPPASGVWSRSVVYSTPKGDPRPGGGVLWRTLGAGVLPDEEFSLVLTMQSAPADDVYEFYCLDAGTHQVLDLRLDWNDLEPISYCTAKINSLGCTPAIGSQGMPSASAPSGFLVTCQQTRNIKPGVMLYSVQGRAAQPFQGGTLCLQAPIRRTLGLVSGGNPGPANDCSGTFAIDMNAFAAGQLGGNPAQELRQPGHAVACQWWSRDPQAQFGSSLSDALEYVVGN